MCLPELGVVVKRRDVLRPSLRSQTSGIDEMLYLELRLHVSKAAEGRGRMPYYFKDAGKIVSILPASLK